MEWWVFCIGDDAQREMTIRLEVEDNFRQLNNDTAP